MMIESLAASVALAAVLASFLDVSFAIVTEVFVFVFIEELSRDPA